MNSSLTPNKQFNSNDPEKQKKLDQMLEYQLELQQKLLTKIKQLEESSSLIESLKSLNKNSKCLNSSRSPVLTRTGPYGYIPGIIGNHSENLNSKLVIYGELSLLLFILLLWVLSIVACFNRYSKLRSLHPVAPAYSHKASPMHIEEIKIVKNEQDAIIYKKSNPYKSSQATLSRALKSITNTDSIANTSIKERFSLYDSQIKSNSLTIDQNEIISSLEKKVNNNNTISTNKKYSESSPGTSYFANHSITTTNSARSLENETARINILQKSNKPFYFSIDNKNIKSNKLPSVEYKKPRVNDSRLIKLKRNLFAKSKVNLFRTKESFNSNHLGDEAPLDRSRLNSLVSINLTKRTSDSQEDESNQVTININDQNLTEDLKENHLLAPNWVSQTTIEKIRENLLDLHHLVRTEKRPSLLQLSKISKSESKLSTNIFSTSSTDRKPISLSLQNSKRENKFDKNECNDIT